MGIVLLDLSSKLLRPFTLGRFASVEQRGSPRLGARMMPLAFIHLAAFTKMPPSEPGGSRYRGNIRRSTGGREICPPLFEDSASCLAAKIAPWSAFPRSRRESNLGFFASFMRMNAMTASNAAAPDPTPTPSPALWHVTPTSRGLLGDSLGR